jgi:hypothetical protein
VPLNPSHLIHLSREIVKFGVEIIFKASQTIHNVS